MVMRGRQERRTEDYRGSVQKARDLERRVLHILHPHKGWRFCHLETSLLEQEGF